MLALSGIQVHRLWVRLSWCGCAVSYVNTDAEWPHNVHANEAGRRFQAHNDDEAGPTTSFTLLEVQMLSLPSNLEWFAVRTVHSPLKWPQGAPLSAEAPPNVEPHAGHRGSRVH